MEEAAAFKRFPETRVWASAEASSALGGTPTARVLTGVTSREGGCVRVPGRARPTARPGPRPEPRAASAHAVWPRRPRLMHGFDRRLPAREDLQVHDLAVTQLEDVGAVLVDLHAAAPALAVIPG